MEQLTFWSEEPHVRTCPSPEKEKGSPASDPDLHSPISDFLRQCAPAGSYGKMCRASLAPTAEKISKRSSDRLMKSGIVARGECWTLNMSEWTDTLVPFLSADGVCSLSDILEPTGDIPPRYFLSRTACLGILRRAEKRGRALPEALQQALEAQAGKNNSSISSETEDR